MKTRSKSMTLRRRWEIMMTVRPRRSSLMTRWIVASVLESILHKQSLYQGQRTKEFGIA